MPITFKQLCYYSPKRSGCQGFKKWLTEMIFWDIFLYYSFALFVVRFRAADFQTTLIKTKIGVVC